MDPLEVLDLCKRGALEGAPADIVVPHLFSQGEFEDMWKREPQRVRRLIDELLCGPHADDGLDLLLKSGALHALVPELVAIKDLGDDPMSSLHKDVWRHTTLVVMGVPANVELRWSALMHDIGKSRTRKFVGNRVTFHNHDVVGAQMLDRIDQRLDLFRDDSSLFTTVRSLVLNHLRPAGYKASWTDSGVRRLLTDVGGLRGFERLMSLSRADLTTKNPNKRDRAIARGNELEARVAQVYAADRAPKLPKGVMGEVLKRVATKPGAWCNVVRDELEAMMLAGVLEAGRDVSYYVEAGIRFIEEKADHAD
jgi:poly(A) polymerase